MNCNKCSGKTCIFLILYLICFTSVFNSYTLSLFDPIPPLSSEVVIALYGVHLINFFGVGLFFFKRVLLIQLLVGIVFVIIVDLMLFPFVIKDGHKEFRMKQPEPYLQANYFSLSFINESFSQPNGWIIDRETGVVKPSNFEGKWFNVKKHQRLTTNSPDIYKHKLYLFGGSTVYNSEVPDSLTIASQLAYIGANSDSFEVVNMGATSINSSQQFERLKSEVELKKDDVVIFYDGVNDVQQRIVYENKYGYMHGYPVHESAFIKLLRICGRFSSIAKLLINIMNDNVREIPLDLIEKSIDDYLYTLSEAKRHVENAGGKFYHFLQPTLFTKKVYNDYEIFLIKSGNPFVPKQTRSAFIQAYPIIEKKLSTVYYSKSFTNAFDGLTVSPYLDFCHINHIGNEIIAKRIWENIEKKFPNN